MVTVSDVLALPALQLVAHGLPHPDARVRWVATSELEDPSPFLEGGEILLTTGIVTEGWRAADWRLYADRLTAVGVAALGLGTGLTHRRIPAALSRACQAAGLNLVEVPAGTTFVAISQAGVHLLEESERAVARDALEMQRALTQAALREDDTRALLSRLATILGGGACLVTSDGQLSEGPFGQAAERLDLEQIAGEIGRIRAQGLRASSSITAAPGTTVIHPVGLRGRPTSYLAAFGPARPTQPQRSAVATAVALLSLALQRRSERRDTERLIRSRAAELLVAGDARTARLVLALAAGLEPDRVSLPGRGQVLRVTGVPDALEDALSALEDDAALAAWHADELWVLAQPAQSAGLAATLADQGLRVGVGQVSPLARLPRSHATAGHALAQATSATPVVRWDRLVDEGPLALVDREQAELFAESFLAPLESGGDELLTTLTSFLRHHGARAKVAEELGVHRNTVRNRLEAIEAALGDSLDDPQVRVNAWVALQARNR